MHMCAVMIKKWVTEGDVPVLVEFQFYTLILGLSKNLLLEISDATSLECDDLHDELAVLKRYV